MNRNAKPLPLTERERLTLVDGGFQISESTDGYATRHGFVIEKLQNWNGDTYFEVSTMPATTKWRHTTNAAAALVMYGRWRGSCEMKQRYMKKAIKPFDVCEMPRNE